MPVTFDLNRALSSPEYAKMCYINYNTTNSMEISKEDYGTIIGHYDTAIIKSWEQYSKDENRYEWTEDEHENAIEKGKQQGRNMTGYDNNGADKFDQTGRAVGDGLMATATGARALAGAGKMVSNGACAVKSGAGILKNAKAAGSIVKDGEKACVAGGVQSTKEACNWLLLASCALDLAMGIIAVAKPANKEQADACKKLSEEMPELQGDSNDITKSMNDWNTKLQELGDSAIQLNEEANTSMGENRANIDVNLRVIDYFNSKQSSGYKVDKSDYEDYEESVALVSEYDKAINEVNETAAADKEAIYVEMNNYQGNYDDAAGTIDYIQGITDYSAEFDEKTEKLCQVEKYMQWLNVAGCVVDTVQAAMRITPATWFYAVAAASAAAGGVMSGIAAVKQGEYQQIAANEVDLRVETQEVNGAARTTYDENIDYFEGYVQDVENLALVRPDDYAVPPGSMSGESTDDGSDEDVPGGKRNKES